MSRGTRALAPAITAVVVLVAGVLAVAAPAGADRGFDVPDDAVITIKGDGSGHGRGMSQYGAYSAARQGEAYREILRTYYPRTRWDRVGGWLEVLVSADDDDDLVVHARPGLKVHAVGGGTWPADVPGATRWRLRPDGAGGTAVHYLNGSWEPWRTLAGDAQLTSGSRPMRLVVPGGTVAYRGVLRSTSDDVGDRVTVNELPLEQYLRGVVPSEMPASWPRHALRAQAVASRSYATWRRVVRPLDVAYDLCDTAACQVYGGASAEKAATTAAVRKTAKRVLTYRRVPIFAEYSASNGGYTVKGDAPYLPARRDPYEGRSADYYGWTRRITAAEMEAEYHYDDLDLVRVVERDGNGRRGGRVERVRVTAASGFTDTITGDAFRIDWSLPSTLFEITRVDRTG